MPSDKDNSESPANKVSAARDAKNRIETRLREAQVGVDRSASVEDGTKECYNHEEKRPPSEISGNYTIHGGEGLVILDIDVPKDDLPKWVANLPETFFTESPHGGFHLYYIVEDDALISNSDVGWGSVRYDGWYTLGPGSVIDHDDFCGDDCSLKRTSRYEIGAQKPIATLTGEHLKQLRKACDSEKNTKREEEFRTVEVSEDLIQQARENIRYFQANCTALAFEDLMDLLCGGTGSISGLRHDSQGAIDRDKADLEALWMLYGIMLFADESEDDTAELTYSAYTHYCKEKQYMKDGQNKRKWLTRPETYRQSRLAAAIEGFNIRKWHRWRLRNSADGFDPTEHYGSEREYSGIKKTLALAIIDIHTGILTPDAAEDIYEIDLSSLSAPSCHNMGPGGDHGPIADQSYPTPKEIRDELVEADGICSERTAKNVLRDLRREGDLKWAELEEGVEYRIYPSSFPDPPEANRIKSGGEEYVPEEEDVDSSASKSDQELVTDGGVQAGNSEARQEIEQINDARDGRDSPEDQTLLACPIDGCSKMFIEEGPLRNHVSQSDDDLHRYRTLDDDLEVETAWSEMDWGPGAPASVVAK